MPIHWSSGTPKKRGRTVLRHSRGEMKEEYRMSKSFALDRPSATLCPSRSLKQSGYKMLNTFEATRGCIHHCDFCVVPNAWGSRPWQ